MIPGSFKTFEIPHRLFYPFSFEHNDDTECEVALNFGEAAALPLRGTKAFPDGLTFQFVEAEK